MQMRDWVKAAAIASLVEIPLLWKLKNTPVETHSHFITIVLGWYHLPGIWFANVGLLLWNPGPRSGPTRASIALEFGIIYLVQMIIGTFVIVLIFKGIRLLGGTEKESK